MARTTALCLLQSERLFKQEAEKLSGPFVDKSSRHVPLLDGKQSNEDREPTSHSWFAHHHGQPATEAQVQEYFGAWLRYLRVLGFYELVHAQPRPPLSTLPWKKRLHLALPYIAFTISCFGLFVNVYALCKDADNKAANQILQAAGLSVQLFATVLPALFLRYARTPHFRQLLDITTANVHPNFLRSIRSTSYMMLAWCLAASTVSVVISTLYITRASEIHREAPTYFRLWGYDLSRTLGLVLFGFFNVVVMSYTFEVTLGAWGCVIISVRCCEAHVHQFTHHLMRVKSVDVTAMATEQSDSPVPGGVDLTAVLEQHSWLVSLTRHCASVLSGMGFALIGLLGVNVVVYGTFLIDAHSNIGGLTWGLYFFMLIFVVGLVSTLFVCASVASAFTKLVLVAQLSRSFPTPQRQALVDYFSATARSAAWSIGGITLDNTLAMRSVYVLVSVMIFLGQRIAR